MESSCLTTKHSSWKCGREAVCKRLHTNNSDCRNKWNFRRLFIRQRNHLPLAPKSFIVLEHHLIGIRSYEHFRERRTSSYGLVSRSVLFYMFLIILLSDSDLGWGCKTGGGFASGNTHPYLPDLLITSSTRPLIFVSFEYRLGQFGFLGQSIYHVCIDVDFQFHHRLSRRKPGTW